MTAPPQESAPTQTGDRVFSGISRAAGLVILAALAGVFIFLSIEGIPGLFQDEGAYKGNGNFLGYVDTLLFGTVLSATIAVLVAVPLAFGIALVVSHYAPTWIAGPVASIIDLLAAVPSVVFGLWGINVFAPKMVPIYVWLEENLGFLPFFKAPVNPVGTTILTAGLVLAIMILPIITAISREVFNQTPVLHEEAALALGATRWEMIRLAVFPYARSGMVSAVMLGLGRALGETMAVAMVLSGAGGISFNLIGTSNPTSIAANIASQYKENTPATLHILIATGLVLFIVTFLVNFAARWIVARNERKLTR
ncbi:phosphate ABC transporter permease subunit PstC [Nocardioides currus]|uniref:Phosphate transport system permease protein n=1 Tax=Nocardioides currus TaxID=2133958 RepID=A0A2R7YYN5_9ACTN|nr:phosphate ABC transporter permease subunit PstC [Nocardioides currus]